MEIFSPYQTNTNVFLSFINLLDLLIKCVNFHILFKALSYMNVK